MIDAKALEAAMNAWRDWLNSRDNALARSQTPRMSAAIEAYLRALPASGGEGVIEAGLLAARDLAKTMEGLTGCRSDDDYVWSAQAKIEAAIATLSLQQGEVEPFQHRVQAAHEALFHDDPTDLPERTARFYEEATETVQALGMTEDDAHRLVSYTFSRAPGDVRKEIGAAALTLASLCVIGGWDMMECAETDLEKLQRPETIARIRAKRATRHGRGPLPGFDPTPQHGSVP